MRKKILVCVYHKDLTHTDEIDMGLSIYETDCPIKKLPIRDEKKYI